MLRSFELMPTASIISIKYEIQILKCKFKTVDDILNVLEVVELRHRVRSDSSRVPRRKCLTD